MIYVYALSSVAGVSLISFLAIVLCLYSTMLKKYLSVSVGVAIGSLLGEACIHALPESLAAFVGNTKTVGLLVLAGITAFFLLEKLLRWHHSHERVCSTEVHPVAHMVLIANLAHNLIDGMLIAAAFLMSTEVGVATTLAIILHEIPQEISSFNVAVSLGMGVKKALTMNVLSMCASLSGALCILMLGSGKLAEMIVPMSAGGFLYIALSDLVPRLHHERTTPRQAFVQAVAIGSGILLMALV
jgi:zinc and cadmium transporter